MQLKEGKSANGYQQKADELQSSEQSIQDLDQQVNRQGLEGLGRKCAITEKCIQEADGLKGGECRIKDAPRWQNVKSIEIGSRKHSVSNTEEEEIDRLHHRSQDT